MKQPYWMVIGLAIGVVLTVLFVPGVAEYIERTLLGWVASWASCPNCLTVKNSVEQRTIAHPSKPALNPLPAGGRPATATATRLRALYGTPRTPVSRTPQH